MSSKFTVPTLRGIIIRDEHDKVIVQASPADVQRFAPQRGREVNVQPAQLSIRTGPVSRFHGQSSAEPDNVGRISPMEYLYDKNGKPVARIRQATVYTDPIAVHSLSSMMSEFMQGLTRVEITAEGLPGVQVV